MTHIAFIGVGNMGGPMARNLLKAGEGVSAFDLSEAMLAPVVGAGAAKAASVKEAVQDAMSSSPCCLPGSMCARSISTTGS